MNAALPLAAVAVAGACLAGGFALVSWRLWSAYFGPQAHRCRYQRDPVAAPHLAGTLVTDDGVGLAYRYLAGRLPYTVVVAGGYRRCIEEAFALAAHLNQAGFCVLTFEFRGVAAGTHRLLAGGTREAADLRAAIQRARALAGPQPLGVLGLCLGATAAVLVAAGGEPIDALWLDGPFKSPVGVLSHAVRLRVHLPGAAFAWTVALGVRLTRGLSIWRVRADRAAQRIADLPVRTVVTDDDLATPGQRDMGRGIGAGARESVVHVPGVRHAGAYFVAPGPYVAEAVRFFTEAFAGSAELSGEPAALAALRAS